MEIRIEITVEDDYPMTIEHEQGVSEMWNAQYDTGKEIERHERASIFADARDELRARANIDEQMTRTEFKLMIASLSALATLIGAGFALHLF